MSDQKLSPNDPAPRFTLQPIFGLPVSVDENCPRSLLVFVRNLDSSHARATITALQKAHQTLDTVPVIIFTRTNLEDARDFVPRHHILHRVVSDPEGQWFDAYHVGQDRGLMRTLTDFEGLAQLPTLLSQGRGKPTAPFTQLPAAFIVEKGIILEAWYGQSILSMPDIDTLVQNVTR